MQEGFQAAGWSLRAGFAAQFSPGLHANRAPQTGIAFLCSEQARNLAGHSITLDGGMLRARF